MGRYHTGTFPAVKPPRKVYMDVLRVIATVFVICVHTVALAKTTAAPGTLLFRVLEVFNYTFLSCNLFFVMISGALLLPVKGERCRDFFAESAMQTRAAPIMMTSLITSRPLPLR